MTTKRLTNGFVKLQETDLTDLQIQLLLTAVIHGDVPKLFYKHFFKEAYERSSPEHIKRQDLIKEMSRIGFIEMSFIPNSDNPGLTLDKYDVHPELLEHLTSKYSEYFSRDPDKPKHVISLGFEQSGQTFFHKSFRPTKDIQLKADSTYVLHFTIKDGKAILEIKEMP